MNTTLPKIIGVREMWSPGFSSKHHLQLTVKFPDCDAWIPQIDHECVFRTVPGISREYRDKTYPLVVGSWGPFRVYEFASLTTEQEPSPHWTAPPWVRAPVDGIVRPLYRGFSANPRDDPSTAGSYLQIEYMAAKSGNLYHTYIEEKALQELLWKHQPMWVIREEYGHAILHKTNPKPFEVRRKAFGVHPRLKVNASVPVGQGRWTAYVEWISDEGCRSETSWLRNDYKSEAEADAACDAFCRSKGFEPKRRVAA